MPIPYSKTQKQALTLTVKVMSVQSAGMYNKNGGDEMNPSEEAVLNVARSVLSQEELETLVRLLRLRHSPRAVVRISANMALIPLLDKIKGVC